MTARHVRSAPPHRSGFAGLALGLAVALVVGVLATLGSATSSAAAPDPAEPAPLPAADLLDVDFDGATATDRAQGLPRTEWGTPTYTTDADRGQIMQVTAPSGNPQLADDAVSFDWAGQWSKITDGFAVECVFRVDTTMPIGSEKDLCSSKEAGGLSLYVTGGTLGTMAHIGGDYRRVLSPIEGNTWYHAVSVWDGASLTLYLNGAPVGSTPATGAFLAPPNAATHRFVIGGDASPTGVGQWAPPASFLGSRVWSKKLNAAEVAAAAAEYGFEVTVPKADILDVDFADGTPTDHAQGLALKTWGAPTITDDSALGRKVGVFDGVDDAYGYRFYEQWDALANGYSIECTFKFDAPLPAAQEEDICSSKEAGGTSIAIYGDELTFNPHTGGSYRGVGMPMQPGRWYHAVGVWDGASAHLYVNGLLQESGAAPGALGKPSATATQWVLGADAANNEGAQFYAPTTIAASRVYSRALDTAQIGSLYAAELGSVPGAQVRLDRTVPAKGDHLTEPTTFDVEVTNADHATNWSYRLDGEAVEPGDEIGPGMRAGDHRLVITATGVFGEAYSWTIDFTSTAIPTGGGTGSGQGNGSVSLSAIATSPDGSDVTTTFRAADATPAADGVSGVVATMPTTLDFDFTEESPAAGTQLPDGEMSASASTKQIPFQRYDVAVSGAVAGQRIVWSGVADPERSVSLHAWDTTASRWVQVGESRGVETGDTVVTGRIKASQVDGQTVHVLVTGIDPFADDLAPRDESAQSDKDTFEDPSDYDFSLAHFTDTQYLSEGAAGGTYNDFDGVDEPTDLMQPLEQDVWASAYEASTQWIADNAQSRKIAYAAHTGDVIENDYNNPLATDANGNLRWPGLDEQVTAEFDFTSAAQATMDDAGVVNQVIAGNHDNQLGNESGPDSRFNRWYGPERYYDAAQKWPEGASYHAYDEVTDENGATVTQGQDNQNNYILFSAGGLDFVAVGLSYGVTQEEAAWANDVFERYGDRNGILITHAYLAPSSAPDGRGSTFSADGNRLYDQVVADNPNVFLVLAGHEHGVGTNVKSDVGATVSHNVVELLADYQFYKVSAGELWPDKVVNGRIDLDGDGVADHNASDLLQFGASFLRLLQFDVERSQVSIDTYSPYFDNFGATEYDDRHRYNGAEDNLVLPVDLETRKTSFETDALTVVTPTDTVIGEATAKSGWPATVKWSGLKNGELYAWVADSRTAGGEVVRGLRQFGGVFVATAAGTDVTAPVLTVPSGADNPDNVVEVGVAFDPMAGVTAIDDSDGDVTADVEVSGLVDTATAGTYGLTYVVRDANGNQAIASRVVMVKEPAEPVLTATKVASGNVKAAFGDDVTLRATVSPNTATGTVEFLNGEDALCTATVENGVATCKIGVMPPPGEYVVNVVYSGDAKHETSRKFVVLTITEKTLADARLSAKAKPATVKAGKPVRLVATVAKKATGKVTFTSGGKRLCAATVVDGRATCTLGPRLKAGTYRVVATYGGDDGYATDRTTFRFRKLKR
ncbi:Ig-like domain repeat protein [Nocardioides sp. GXZ039]|uniref:Ig-like domain repeat protein n=1 Tax=Nocardioides sp. GXZ039 TaxID=3136018 RepID=UPI0030F392CE